MRKSNLLKPVPISETMDLKAYLEERRARINGALDRLLPEERDYPPDLHRAMRYSLFAGGKRLRPVLTLAGCEAAGGEPETALAAACAVEMVHTYSLIHDDLPAMDDDDLRRGVATNHKVFGEALAILAGDALLTLAFGVVADGAASSLQDGTRLQIVGELVRAAGSRGMVGGQSVDILSERAPEIDLPTLEYIHTHKTGAMIRGAVRIGGLAAGAPEETMKALTLYGDRVGLAFQIADDVLDVIGTEKELGKQVGHDRKRGKKTYPGLYGVAESRDRAHELAGNAVAAIGDLGARAEPLRAIAHYIVERVS